MHCKQRQIIRLQTCCKFVSRNFTNSRSWRCSIVGHLTSFCCRAVVWCKWLSELSLLTSSLLNTGLGSRCGISSHRAFLQPASQIKRPTWPFTEVPPQQSKVCFSSVFDIHDALWLKRFLLARRSHVLQLSRRAVYIKARLFALQSIVSVGILRWILEIVNFKLLLQKLKTKPV